MHTAVVAYKCLLIRKDKSAKNNHDHEQLLMGAQYEKKSLWLKVFEEE